MHIAILTFEGFNELDSTHFSEAFTQLHQATRLASVDCLPERNASSH